MRHCPCPAELPRQFPRFCRNLHLICYSPQIKTPVISCLSHVHQTVCGLKTTLRFLLGLKSPCSSWLHSIQYAVRLIQESAVLRLTWPREPQRICEQSAPTNSLHSVNPRPLVRPPRLFKDLIMACSMTRSGERPPQHSLRRMVWYPNSTNCLYSHGCSLGSFSICCKYRRALLA